MASVNPPAGSQPPLVELVVRQGPQPGQLFSLTGPSITIGREVGNDVVINHPQISRRHASLTWDGRQFIIQDLGSSNGTAVNGVRLTAPQVLQSGDAIGLGSTVLLGFQVALPVVGGPDSLMAAPGGPPGYAPPPPAQAATPPKRARRILIPLIAVLGLCCLLVAGAALAYFFLFPGTRDEARPVVLIRSPRHGEQVEMGQGVTVHSVARDEGKVVRVELWVDGQLQESQTSSLPGGTSPFPLLARWQPASPGTHTLVARAFNAQGGQGQASVNVEVVPGADQDGDGVSGGADMCPDEPGPGAADGCPDGDGDAVPDNRDECPDQPGLPLTEGCPDADGDTMPDSRDECPDQPGPPMTEGCPDADGDTIPDGMDACPGEPGAPEAPGGDGCPARTGEDRDGDGILDGEDDCPDEGGSPVTEGCPDADGDGVRDGEDGCPAEPGPLENHGCPGPVDEVDSDGDGVHDADDACPDEPGPEPGGCPDRDGDGVPDPEDLRPGEPGPPDGGGAPDTGAGDRDGDGIADDVDLCPDEPGVAAHAGCPPAEGPETDEGGVFGDIGGWERVDFVWVEFQALEFEVFDDYDEVYCYAGLAGGDMDRYGPFEIGDEERHWSISEELGSRVVHVVEGQPLQVEVECWAANIYLEPGGAWGPVWDLGAFIVNHPPSDWDGHLITVGSSGGHPGHSFQAQYRICAGGCEGAAFAPPFLTLWHGLGDQLRLQWAWDGDESAINGFRLYVNGNFYRAFRPDQRSWVIPSDLDPACGERLEFQVTAFEGPTPVPNRESPASNIRFLEGLPCARSVRVTFDRLRTYNLEDGDPNRNWDSRRLGPVFGSFCAQGSTEACLSFNGSDFPHGLMLQSQHTHSIQGLFNWILGEMSLLCTSPSDCPRYYAPESDSVTVDLGLGDDLTFMGVIYEQDNRTYGEAFNASESISADEIRPGYSRTIRDRQIELTVRLDVVSSYEAGATAGSSMPDLAIADVDQHEPSGQLRIHVSNDGGDLVGEDIAVALARISTNEMIDVVTWENVTIPSGEQRILQTASPIVAGDLRVIVDPDNDIEETYEGNNIYETPALMRVEFVGLRVPDWPCEGFLHQEAEVWFLFWVGYGPPDEEPNWVGNRVRHPASGIVEWNRNDWPPPTWSLEGQERYIFEFEIPSGENLRIMIDGYEEDWTTRQSMGVIAAEYGPQDNYGGRSDPYQARSVGLGTENCVEWEPIGPRFFGFEAWWRITRLR